MNRRGMKGNDRARLARRGLRAKIQVCDGCGLPLHAHDREREYDERGPAGTYRIKRECPE